MPRGTTAVPVPSVVPLPITVPSGCKNATFAPALKPPKAGTTVTGLTNAGGVGVTGVTGVVGVVAVLEEEPPPQATKTVTATAISPEAKVTFRI